MPISARKVQNFPFWENSSKRRSGFAMIKKRAHRGNFAFLGQSMLKLKYTARRWHIATIGSWKENIGVLASTYVKYEGSSRIVSNVMSWGSDLFLGIVSSRGVSACNTQWSGRSDKSSLHLFLTDWNYWWCLNLQRKFSKPWCHPLMFSCATQAPCGSVPGQILFVRL